MNEIFNCVDDEEEKEDDDDKTNKGENFVLFPFGQTLS